ncbi:MAG: Rieske 2Fe-2S domain-containing protein [Myxococcales bacterium]|nr:Rieske 2Fe-2S domain-containing protein [Deltaproteobacteria bacterium]NND27533.1 Rieske 2Fe-2S domain-containing protein [Myxococcales bacterium]MBT8480575.1 Rieske 2Fe-2S domain-containing protein [Deltaproteobacteria bacterium]NNK09058.1 Rieske 2Fe-2S domain-containing protein [Myxococcales bacterium]NNK41530.1 Rieske 2Fe-2S domain-containing protein [Myxococcales bacterium]
MERAKQVELLSECLGLVQAKRPFVTEDETLIPVAQYIDEGMFEQERALLRRSMNIVAQSSQLASPGDFMTRDILGTPVLLVRHVDGTAKAFVNVCRHRGATVELRDAGNCRRFVCPYHAWSYGTDGSLATVRYAEGFPTLDIENTSLVALPCFEAAGLLWVCPEPSRSDWAPDDATRELIRELEGLGCADSSVFTADTKVWNANWKLIVDGGLEAYHFRIAHRNTIAGFFPDNVSTFELLGDHVRSVLPRTSILELAQQPESSWDIREHTHVLYSIAPNASLLLQERHFELILSTPISVDQTRIELMTVAPDPGPDGFSEKAKGFLAANSAFTRKTLEEDFEIAEQIQSGMRTGANEHFRFASFEGALTQWHRRLNEKLGRV